VKDGGEAKMAVKNVQLVLHVMEQVKQHVQEIHIQVKEQVAVQHAMEQ
jgi:hypothetical protein